MLENERVHEVHRICRHVLTSLSSVFNDCSSPVLAHQIMLSLTLAVESLIVMSLDVEGREKKRSETTVRGGIVVGDQQHRVARVIHARKATVVP